MICCCRAKQKTLQNGVGYNAFFRTNSMQEEEKGGKDWKGGGEGKEEGAWLGIMGRKEEEEGKEEEAWIVFPIETPLH